MSTNEKVAKTQEKARPTKRKREKEWESANTTKYKRIVGGDVWGGKIERNNNK